MPKQKIILKNNASTLLIAIELQKLFHYALRFVFVGSSTTSLGSDRQIRFCLCQTNQWLRNDVKRGKKKKKKA